MQTVTTEISNLEGAVVLSNLARGTEIYSPGDPSDRVFVLRSGQVKVSVLGPGGKHCIFHVFEPGDVFGEDALFDWGSRKSGAEVIERASVTMVPRESVLLHGGRHPEFWKSFAELLGLRIKNLEDQLQWVSLLEVEQRIVRLLLRWVEAASAKGLSPETLPFRLSQKHLAGLIGATRETTSNALNRLQRKGCLEIRRRRVIIKSVDGLRQAGIVAAAAKLGPDRETAAAEAAKAARTRGRAAQA